MPRTPLSHLRVVDLTDLRGALAGRLLADLGSDVVKVEPPGGDPDRLHPPFAGDVAAKDRSLAFLYRHANKRGATLDLDDASDRRRFDELCDRADVLIENLDLRRRAELHLDPAEVNGRHPHLVHVAIADFGLSGPCAGWRLEALPAFAASGALYASGFPELRPCWLPGHAAHDCASVFAVAGALAALATRRRDGFGQTVEVSVQEAALHCLNPWSIPLADYARHYATLTPSPRRNGNSSYHVFATADGWVRTVPGTPRHWRAFVALLGDPEALAGPEWESAVFRLANQDVVRAVASEILRSRPRDRVLAEARRLDVPMVPLNSPDDFVAEEQTRARGLFRRTDFPHLEGAPFCAAPFRFSTLAVSLDRPAPAAESRSETFPPRVPERPSGGPAGPPLAGVRVVDLGVGAVVPELCGLLGELGAEVVKIASSRSVSAPRRTWSPRTIAAASSPSGASITRTFAACGPTSSLNHPDHVAGKLGAVAVLAALEHRRRTGEGQFIDMAQTEAAAYLGGEFYLERAATGRPARAAGNAVAYACPHGVYPCAGDDRWVAIAVVGDPTWQAFRGVASWEDEPALRALEGRLAARHDLERRVAEWTKDRIAEEVVEVLQAAGVSAMPVQSPDDHRGDPHLAARGAIVTVEHPEIGRERHVANPLRMTRTAVRHAGAAPLLGEHTEEVLCGLLGIGADELAKLVADGVCR